MRVSSLNAGERRNTAGLAGVHKEGKGGSSLQYLWAKKGTMDEIMEARLMILEARDAELNVFRRSIEIGSDTVF